jgi:hypothetical protein
MITLLSMENDYKEIITLINKIRKKLFLEFYKYHKLSKQINNIY